MSTIFGERVAEKLPDEKKLAEQQRLSDELLKNDVWPDAYLTKAGCLDLNNVRREIKAQGLPDEQKHAEQQRLPDRHAIC